MAKTQNHWVKRAIPLGFIGFLALLAGQATALQDDPPATDQDATPDSVIDWIIDWIEDWFDVEPPEEEPPADGDSW